MNKTLVKMLSSSLAEDSKKN